MKERINMLEQILLKEIINEVNRKQGVPVSFEKLELIKISDNLFEGKVHCSEPRRVWTIPVQVKLKENRVSWNLYDNGWFEFELEE
jgi:hypothetical protein